MKGLDTRLGKVLSRIHSGLHTQPSSLLFASKIPNAKPLNRINSALTPGFRINCMFEAMVWLTQHLRPLSFSDVVEKAWRAAIGKAGVSQKCLQPLLNFSLLSSFRPTTSYLSASSYILACVRSCDEGNQYYTDSVDKVDYICRYSRQSPFPDRYEEKRGFLMLYSND